VALCQTAGAGAESQRIFVQCKNWGLTPSGGTTLHQSALRRSNTWLVEQQPWLSSAHCFALAIAGFETRFYAQHVQKLLAAGASLPTPLGELDHFISTQESE